MGFYRSNCSGWLAGRRPPALLASFYEFLSRQADGSLGNFCVDPEEIDPRRVKPQVHAATWTFLSLDGRSKIALCEAVQPAPVLLLGMYGQPEQKLAESLEEFLIAWSRDELDVVDLEIDRDADEEEVAAREKAHRTLAAWLKQQGVVAPRVEGPFDVEAFWAGEAARRAALPPAASPLSPRFSPALDQAGPTLAALIRLLGRPAHDPALRERVETVCGKAPPLALTGSQAHVYLSDKARGLKLSFDTHVEHRATPPIPVGKKMHVPYFTALILERPLDEALPHAIDQGAAWDGLTARFPHGVARSYHDEGEGNVHVEEDFSLPLDEQGHVLMDIDPTDEGVLDVVFRLKQAHGLIDVDEVGQVHEGAGFFLQWALERGGLDESAPEFAAHGALLAAMKTRSARPSALTAVAFPAGLWDDHLQDQPGLRDFAYSYFRNLDGLSLLEDLMRLFGKRKNASRYDRPKIDDDDPVLFDRIFAVFDAAFATYQANQKALAQRAARQQQQPPNP